jgi:hypothetical protein
MERDSTGGCPASGASLEGVHGREGVPEGGPVHPGDVRQVVAGIGAGHGHARVAPQVCTLL